MLDLDLILDPHNKKGVEQQNVHTMQASLSQVVRHWSRLIIQFKIIFLIRSPAFWREKRSSQSQMIIFF